MEHKFEKAFSGVSFLRDLAMYMSTRTVQGGLLGLRLVVGKGPFPGMVEQPIAGTSVPEKLYSWLISKGSPSFAFVVASCSCATLFSLCVFSRYLIKTMYQRLSSIFGIYVNHYICQYKRHTNKELNRGLQSGGKRLKLVEHISLGENLQVTFE